MPEPLVADDGPIFIGGPGRSGKTLLRWILSCHPRIAVSHRTEMWPSFAGRFGDLDDRDRLDRCLDELFARRHVAELGVDRSRLVRELERGPVTYAHLFALMHEQYAERTGAVRWGDQTASITRWTDEIMRAYPRARVIHLMRDPRDRHLATLAKGRRVSVGRSTAVWLRSADLAMRHRASHPDRYAVVRYESLVTRPEETVRAVCDLIGERFEPAMVRLEGVERYRARRERTGSAITDSFVGVWREELDAADLAFIQSAAGSRMADLGYERVPVRLSGGNRLRALVTWPGNAAAVRGSQRSDEVAAR